MKAFIFHMAFLFSVLNIQAQQIKGAVNDENGSGLKNVFISLKKSADGSTVKLAISDDSGGYIFDRIGTGKYFVTASFTGYQDRRSEDFEVTDGAANVPAIILKKDEINLKEVVITSQKPLVEVRADKLVLNVENSVNAIGQDAMELLRKSPGVVVDKDDNLSLNGKSGVQVYINGKPSPLAGSDLSEYLKAFQSTQIEAIEIISNPSSRYDAAGNAGIINIRLKKNKAFGTNGTFTVGLGMANNPKYNTGLTLNHRKDNLNLFGSYSYNQRKNDGYLNTYRKLTDSVFNQSALNVNQVEAHSFQGGADYIVDQKNTVGVLLNGTLSDSRVNFDNRTVISYAPTSVTTRSLTTNTRSKSTRNNGAVNLNYRFADAKSHSLGVDADYGVYSVHTDQLVPNRYYSNTGTFLYDNTYRLLSPTTIQIYSLKADYEQKLGKGALGLGAKSSYVNSANDFREYTVNSAAEQLNTGHSDNFEYRENINALYASYNQGFKNFTFQAGLRAEQTNARGISQGYSSAGSLLPDSTFHRNNIALFPSASIIFNHDPMRQWSANYSRRIDRPLYTDLNPFEFKLDDYNFRKGNTRLTPQFTNSIGLTYLYKQQLNTSINYSNVKDVFGVIRDTINKSMTYVMKRNLASQNILSLSMSYNRSIGWYTVFANLNSYYVSYKGNFGSGKTINMNTVATEIFLQQSFRLGKGWSYDLSGFYNSPTVIQGTTKLKGYWSSDAGLQKSLLQNKALLKFSVSDIFHTLYNTGTIDYAGQYILAKSGGETRVFRLAFSWRLGNSQLKVLPRHKAGTADENKRSDNNN